MNSSTSFPSDVGKVSFQFCLAVFWGFHPNMCLFLFCDFSIPSNSVILLLSSMPGKKCVSQLQSGSRHCPTSFCHCLCFVHSGCSKRELGCKLNWFCNCMFVPNKMWNHRYIHVLLDELWKIHVIWINLWAVFIFKQVFITFVLLELWVHKWCS